MMTGRKMMLLGTFAVASTLSLMVGTTAAVAGLKFREPQSSPVGAGDSPFRIAVADLDGDGDQDLAIANYGSNNVTILRNNGAGNFTYHTSSPVAVDSYPSSIAAADLDGDGDPDLAVTNFGLDSNSVTILRNNGAGKFTQAASSPVQVGDGPWDIVAADLDGDGDQDLAVANERSVSDSVTILRNNGSGKFTQLGSSPLVGDGFTAIVAADFDGDGDQDLAVVNAFDNDVAILRNNGAGKFTQPTSSPVAVGKGPSDIVAADLDGDGDQDLAVANESSEKVTILRNNGAGKFTQSGSKPVLSGNLAIAAADLDGDGDQDLALANTFNVTILRNDGAGKFTQPASSPVSAGDDPHGIAAADLDRDGDPDLAVTNGLSDNVTILVHRH